MKPLKKLFKPGIVGLLILILTIFMLLPFPALVLSTQNSSPFLIIPMLYEKGFVLEYVHSVQKTPVQELFVLAPENQLLLTATYYQSLGVGLPFLPEEGHLINDNGVFRLTDINRLFEKIDLAFIPLAKQALLYHGRRYDLQDYWANGTILEIKVEKYSAARIAWQWSKEVNIDWFRLP